MKKRLKSTLLIILMAIAALFALAGCTLGDSLDKVLSENNLEAQVTYYVNNENAKFTPNTAKKKEVYYRAGSKVLDIGHVGNIGVECAGYEFVGWYYIKEDANTKELVTVSDYVDPSDKSTHYIYELGEAVDFSKRINAGEHWHLAAQWVTVSKVNIELVIENAPDAKIDIDESKVAADSPLYGKKEVGQGDVIKTSGYDTQGNISSIGGNPIPQKDGGFTFVNYYVDKACTTLVGWPLKKQTEDVTIYAKYIVGDWKIVSTPSEVEDMFEGLGSSSNHYWLLNDVDCGPANISITPKARVLAEIQGNGYTISNLKVTIKAGTNTSSMSMFKDITASAKIENLTFTGLQLEFTMRTKDIESIHFAFTSIEEGATITNVSLQGSMTIIKPVGNKIFNMSLEDGGYQYTKCLYGGYESDAAYITATGGNGFRVVGDNDPSAFISVVTA